MAFKDRIKELRRVPASSLLAHPGNWRTHPAAQKNALTEVLGNIGWADAITAREDASGVLHIIDGHLRADVDPEAVVPVLVLDVTEAEADQLLLVFDPLTMMAGADMELLGNLVGRLGTYADQGLLTALTCQPDLLTSLGWEPPVPEVPPSTFTGDPDELPGVVPTRVQPGDLWRLGSHRVLCGDSTSLAVVGRLMAGERARLVFTDPPYGVEYDSGRFAVLTNDDVILPVAPVVAAVLEEDAAAFIWTCHQTYTEWRAQFAQGYKHTLVWYKRGGGLGDLEGNYATDYELCLFWVKGRPRFRGKRGMAVWEVAKDGATEYQHPTQKPVALSERAMEDFSAPGDIVWDGFLGSGSTLIGAERTGRRCYGLELEPAYCDVVLARWEAATGQQAELLEREGPAP